jgi:hypothetical protein
VGMIFYRQLRRLCYLTRSSPRLGYARGYTLAPANAGSAARVAQVANLRYKRTRANCLFIAFDD